jgi:pimeloyl-ACP methyl ester carboxylesterase
MRLVLLHSLPLDGTMWENCLSIDCDEVIAPTLYGFGDSLEAWAVGILGLVGGDPFVVAGNSIGGSCALEVAKLAPDSVAGIVLIGAKAGHRREPEFRDEAIRRLSDGGMAEAWPAYWEPLIWRKRGSRGR